MDRIYVMQLVRSFQCGEINRRQFLQRTSLALGSTVGAHMLLAACTPLPAQPPAPVVQEPQATATPEPGEASPAPADEPQIEEGVIIETVEYPDADGATLTGYLARPTDTGPRPAILVIQEWWGVDEHIKDVTRRIAREGFVALAPDLYHGVVVSEPDEARKMVMELDMADAVREIRQAIRFLMAQHYVAGAKVGIVGFCMGGRLALQTARAEENLGAVVAFYGTPLTAAEAPDVQAPMLGLYGSADQGIPLDDVRAMEVALQEAGIEHEIHIYEGAPHAFFNDDRPSYRSDVAADAWERTLTWLCSYLESW